MTKIPINKTVGIIALILNITLGLIGVKVGIRLIKNKIALKKALLIEIPIWVIGFLISIITPLFL